MRPWYQNTSVYLNKDVKKNETIIYVLKHSTTFKMLICQGKKIIFHELWSKQKSLFCFGFFLISQTKNFYM